MDSMGTALESFDDFPFGQVTTGDATVDPWNINNSKQCTGNAPMSVAAAAAAPVVLLPPPPASPRIPIGNAMPQAPAALPPGQCSLAANLFPASSAFPSAVSSNVPAQPFPVSVPKPTDPGTTPPEVSTKQQFILTCFSLSPLHPFPNIFLHTTKPPSKLAICWA